MQTLSRFFSLALPFWFNRRHSTEWLLLIAVISFSLAIIHVSVWVTEWNKTFYDALANVDGEQIPSLVLRYLIYIALIVAFIVCGNWLKKMLVFRWRSHLTAQFQTEWLDNHRHYTLAQSNIDNPDQRIAEDCFLLADKTIDLLKYFIMNVAKLVAFITILWQMSAVQTFELWGTHWTVHGYLVWIALFYSLFCTLFMHFIGHKLQPLNIERQHREADYRAELLRIREHSEQIASLKGEAREISRLNQRFKNIRQNWLELINREFKIETFSATYLRLSMFIPIFATLPMYLARTMTFGDMMQARSAFSNVQDGFGWFMDYYKRLIEWAAVVERLSEFKQALNNKKADSQAVSLGENIAIFADNLSVKTAQGRLLFANFSLNLAACEWVLLDGKSGIGKSTLLKTFAGIWQHYQGTVRCDNQSRLFLPQRPYLPQDSLRAVLSYPLEPIENSQKLKAVLEKVGLVYLTEQLDNDQPWQKILSGGEQQRISLARALLQQPKIILLDEATNQLDSDSAVTLMKLLRAELGESLCLAVSHQPEVKALFDKRITL